jgi:hypothetical protein
MREAAQVVLRRAVRMSDSAQQLPPQLSMKLNLKSLTCRLNSDILTGVKLPLM